MGGVLEDPGAVTDAVQHLSERVDALEVSAREIHQRIFSWPEPHRESQVVRTALLVGTTNLPLRIVTTPSFRAFMRQSAPLYRNPSLAALRSAVLTIANQLRVEFTPFTEQGRFCNLMVGTATSGARTWLSFCVSTRRGFSFWRCTSIADQPAATLIERLLEICCNPMRKRFVVCSIVTDNATNEIAAVRDLLKQLGVPVFRAPCLSHTTALALKDFLAQAFPPIAG
jgi:hypothetical protein